MIGDLLLLIWARLLLLWNLLALTEDDQDSVRLLAVEGCISIGKLLEPQDRVSHILPVIVNFSRDISWRVCYMVANQLYELCEAVGPELTKSELVPTYVRLLRDNEAEVCIAAAGKVTKFSRILNAELAIQHNLPCVKIRYLAFNDSCRVDVNCRKKKCGHNNQLRPKKKIK